MSGIYGQVKEGKNSYEEFGGVFGSRGYVADVQAADIEWDEKKKMLCLIII